MIHDRQEHRDAYKRGRVLAPHPSKNGMEGAVSTTRRSEINARLTGYQETKADRPSASLLIRSQTAASFATDLALRTRICSLSARRAATRSLASVNLLALGANATG